MLSTKREANEKSCYEINVFGFFRENSSELQKLTEKFLPSIFLSFSFLQKAPSQVMPFTGFCLFYFLESLRAFRRFFYFLKTLDSTFFSMIEYEKGFLKKEEVF